MKTFRTLCSGGELFGVGARAAGWQHLDGYEIEPKIAAVARLNGFDVRVADVCQIDYESLAPVDHLHASPSCKTASQANVTAGETEGDLAVADAICRAIRAHQGATFSLENVWAYRNYESFARILAALRSTGFVVDFDHVNAADYGVPQTRKRLILRAVRGRDHVPPLHPTHRKGGDMFHPPWVGWLAAIADILDTLPATQPAPWQLARMPAELRESTLIGAGGFDGEVVNVGTDEPVFTVTASRNQYAQLRAFLVSDQSAGAGAGVGVRDADTPAFTLRASDHNGQPRAYIVGGGNTQLAQVDSHARTEDEPMFTVSASDGARKTAAAFLMDGDNARADDRSATVRTGVEPAMTVRGSRLSATRAAIASRWVRMTIQALGRFQTVPDSYQRLTAEINGNGVSCLLARRIMESLQL